jgi:hypothetical protein
MLLQEVSRLLGHVGEGAPYWSHFIYSTGDPPQLLVQVGLVLHHIKFEFVCMQHCVNY